MTESMLGLYRLTSIIEKQKLVFLLKILSLPANSITKEIFLRKYYLFATCKSSVALGFIPDVCNLLVKYRLTDVINQFIHDPSKLPHKHVWKNIVTNSIPLYEAAQWNNRVSNDGDFVFFKALQTSMYNIPSV